MDSRPGSARDGERAPAVVLGEGTPPELVRRWAAEQALLEGMQQDAASGRIRTLMWLGFVVACVGVITLCVVAVLLDDASWGSTPGTGSVVTSSPSP